MPAKLNSLLARARRGLLSVANKGSGNRLIAPHMPYGKGDIALYTSGYCGYLCHHTISSSADIPFDIRLSIGSNPWSSIEAAPRHF